MVFFRRMFSGKLLFRFYCGNMSEMMGFVETTFLLTFLSLFVEVLAQCSLLSELWSRDLPKVTLSYELY